MRKTIFALLLGMLSLPACVMPGTVSIDLSTAAPATSSPLPFYTATLIPTFTPRASLTPAPPTVAPTVAPVSGVTTNQVNVRSAPDSAANSLGLLAVGSRTQVLGKDSSGLWLMIVYPENSSTTAWIAAGYVQFEGGDASSLPVMQASLPALPANTPLLQPTATSNLRFATIKTTINVRAGPASTFESYGMIEAGKVVVITGRNEVNSWIQIEFAGSPDNHGWVAAAYVLDANLQGLPYFNNQAQLIFAPTAAANPGQATLTPTAFAPAVGDGDSEQNPGVRLEFSPGGAETFSYSSELSSPNGDDVDWVAFIPYVATSEAGYVYMRLDCSGNGGVTASLEKDGLPVPDVPQLVCGNYDLAMKVLGGQTYLLILRADGSGGPLRYVSYTLTISAKP